MSDQDWQDLESRDPQGMLATHQRFDSQIEMALGLGLSAGLPEWKGPRSRIIVTGLGGSAIGGDFLRVYLSEDLEVPLLVNRNYSLPGFADASTLVAVCSYSGNTEETLSAFDQAQSSGCRIVCLTSGGELAERASLAGLPCIRIPAGYPPRAALGLSAIPLLVALWRLGFVEDRSREVSRAAQWVGKLIARYHSDTPEAENAAKQLARRLQGRLPIIYGSQDRLEVVAVRWRGQISENGKQLAYSAALPEMNHNEIVGWKHPENILDRCVPVFLRDREDHPRIGMRAGITRELIAPRAAHTEEIWSEGEGWLERLLSLVVLGDFASIYLALLNGENPTPVEVIESLKLQLRGEREG